MDKILDAAHQLSQLRYYSIGIIATNKELSEHFVEILPIEYFNFIDGEILDHTEEYKASGKSFTGESFNVKIDTTATLRAKWLPIGQTNRITPPDVRRGEQVIIYQFGDVDEYYWVDAFQYKHVRRLETAIWSFSDNREENVEDTPESTYWMEVSTHKKVIHLHTSKSDEEPFVYDIQINTKDGRIVIQDDDHNYIFLDSAERFIKLHNKDDTYIEMNKRVINIFSHDEINMTTDKYCLNAKSSIDVKTERYNEKCDKYTLEAEESINTETKEHEVLNDNFTIYTDKEFRMGTGVEEEAKVYFQTPKFEYKVDKIKFKVAMEWIADNTGEPQSEEEPPDEVKFKFKGNVDVESLVTAECTLTAAVVEEAEIEAEEVEKEEVEPEEQEEAKKLEPEGTS